VRADKRTENRIVRWPINNPKVNSRGKTKPTVDRSRMRPKRRELVPIVFGPLAIRFGELVSLGGLTFPRRSAFYAD